MPRLEASQTAPDFTLTDHEGRTVRLARLRRTTGDRLLLPGRDDAGLHQAGVRLPRLAWCACSRPGTTSSASPRTSRRSWRSSWSRSRSTFPLLSDPDKPVLDAYGAYGEKKLYGKTVTGVIRSTVVVGRTGRSSWPSTTSRPPATSPRSARHSGWPLRPRTRPGRRQPRPGPDAAWPGRRRGPVRSGRAEVVKLADTQDLGSCAFGREGSSPFFRTHPGHFPGPAGVRPPNKAGENGFCPPHRAVARRSR